MKYGVTIVGLFGFVLLLIISISFQVYYVIVHIADMGFWMQLLNFAWIIGDIALTFVIAAFAGWSSHERNERELRKKAERTKPE